MLTKIIDFLSLEWVKSCALAVAALVLFFSGFWISAKLHELDMAEKTAAYYASLQEQEKRFREQEHELQTKMAEALELRDAALADASDARADAERVRVNADALADRLSASTESACKRERESLGECVRLLSEGVGLAAEGASVARRDAGDIEVMRGALGVN